MGRWYGWLIAGLLAVAVITLGFGQWRNQQRMANALESGYQRDFYTVLDQVEQLEALLGKGLVSASSRQQVFLLTEVWSRANTAQSALGQLPFTELNLSASRKFLAQMGDYAYSMAKRVAGGRELEPEHKEQLQRFYREVQEYGRVLHRTEQELHAQGYRWGTAVAGMSPLGRQVPKTQGAAAQLDGLKEMDQRFDGLPVLIYDGPYSDQVGATEPKGLAGAAKISGAEAEKRAEEFVNQRDDGHYRAVRTAEVEGSISAYGVTLDGRERPGIVTVDVSIQGGKILSFLNSRPIEEANLSGEEAERKAESFLADRGFANMEKTYAITEGNSRWIVYAAKEGDIRLYPDQVKVQVALDDGEIVGFEGMMYYLNHHRRNLPEPELTQKEAAQKLADHLEVKSGRLALIPLAGGREVLTYEFIVDFEGKTYLIYINALNGEEENILKLVESPQGELTI